MTEPFDSLRDRLTRIEKAFQELRIGFATLSNEVQGLRDDCSDCPGHSQPDDFAPDHHFAGKTPQRRRCEQPPPTLDDITKTPPALQARLVRYGHRLHDFDDFDRLGGVEP